MGHFLGLVLSGTSATGQGRIRIQLIPSPRSEPWIGRTAAMPPSARKRAESTSPRPPPSSQPCPRFRSGCFQANPANPSSASHASPCSRSPLTSFGSLNFLSVIKTLHQRFL